MSRPRFLADHNFRGPIIDGVLRLEPTCEITRAIELGIEASPDEEVLQRAAEESLILLTHDRNTLVGAAHARVTNGLPMKGVLLAKPERALRRRVIDNIVLIWAGSEAEEWDGKVAYLPW